ncbi:MAG TPA: fumarylacetoacetate hydrolase family protein [Terracidiphilus sp.]|jgi:2-keto-4-pentenoate hydratase/2-oxohepta-3-ene-1,7-dioic acid hydratase in catechol pathway
MKFCRFLMNGLTRYGTVEDRNGELWITGSAPAPAEDLAFKLQGVGPVPSFAPMPLSAVQLLPPVTPSKIVCVGRNYRAHVRELGNEMPTEPLIFFKPPSSLLAPGGVIRMPAISQRVDFEGELAVVIGRRTRNLKPDSNWRDVVRGFTLANDVTARDLQNKDDQWTRAKGFDTFCPVGPIVSDELDLDTGLDLETHVNGERRQQGNTLDFIFSLPELLAFITSIFTLEPGDLLLTGTPSGIAPLSAGDRVEVSIPRLGVLVNTVETE